MVAPTISESRDALAKLLKAQFDKLGLKADAAFVQDIANQITKAKTRAIASTSAAERQAAMDRLPFLFQSMKNKLTEGKIKANKASSAAIMAVVETATRVLISAGLGVI